MSAASVTITINGAAAASATDGATYRTNPGSTVTVALTSTTGIKRWILAENGTDSVALQGFTYTGPDKAGNFTVTFVMPLQGCSLPLISETWDGNQTVNATITLQNYAQSVGIESYADAVQTSAVTLTSATVSVDGLTLVQGDVVLLVAQSTGSQNGLYTVGVVGGGNAALTRVPSMASGMILAQKQVVQVRTGGTSWGGSCWGTSNTGAITVGTTTMTFYPRVIRLATILSSGGLNATSLWIQTGATSYATCNSTTNAIRAQVPVAGAGTGYCVFNGSGTDGLQYLIVNWG